MKYRYLAALCLLICWDTSLAEKAEHKAELNRLLVAVSKKEPKLFGSNSMCERKSDFWAAVKKSSLLAVLEQEEGFKEHLIDQNHTVWFIPVSTCFSGNRMGFQMFVRDGSKIKDVETRISGTVENLRLEGNKILFDVTSYAGLSDEYHYAYTYDGKQLTEVLLKHIER